MDYSTHCLRRLVLQETPAIFSGTLWTARVNSTAESSSANQRSKSAGKINSSSPANQQSKSADGIVLFVYSTIPRSKVLLLPRSAQSASSSLSKLGLTTSLLRLARAQSFPALRILTIYQLKHRGCSYITEILWSQFLIRHSASPRALLASRPQYFT